MGSATSTGAANRGRYDIVHVEYQTTCTTKQLVQETLTCFDSPDTIELFDLR